MGYSELGMDCRRVPGPRRRKGERSRVGRRQTNRGAIGRAVGVAGVEEHLGRIVEYAEAATDRRLAIVERIPDEAYARLKDGLVAEGVVVAGISCISLEGHTSWCIGIDRALLPGDEICHVEVLHTTVGIMHRAGKAPSANRSSE